MNGYQSVTHSTKETNLHAGDNLTTKTPGYRGGAWHVQLPHGMSWRLGKTNYAMRLSIIDTFSKATKYKSYLDFDKTSCYIGEAGKHKDASQNIS